MPSNAPTHRRRAAELETVMGVWPGNSEFFVPTPPWRVDNIAQTWRMPVIMLERFPVGSEGGVNYV